MEENVRVEFEDNLIFFFFSFTPLQTLARFIKRANIFKINEHLFETGF
jgi:hypothetical protein